MVQDSRGQEGFVASIRACRFVPLPDIRTVRRILGGSVMVMVGMDGGVELVLGGLGWRGFGMGSRL